MYLIIVVWSVKHFTCSIEGELHMKSILCDTPNLRCTRCQQNAQHLTVIRAFVLDGLVLLTEVKIVGRTMLLSSYLCGYCKELQKW